MSTGAPPIDHCPWRAQTVHVVLRELYASRSVEASTSPSRDPSSLPLVEFNFGTSSSNRKHFRLIPTSWLREPFPKRHHYPADGPDCAPSREWPVSALKPSEWDHFSSSVFPRHPSSRQDWTQPDLTPGQLATTPVSQTFASAPASCRPHRHLETTISPFKQVSRRYSEEWSYRLPSFTQNWSGIVLTS